MKQQQQTAETQQAQSGIACMRCGQRHHTLASCSLYLAGQIVAYEWLCQACAHLQEPLEVRLARVLGKEPPC